MRKLSKKQKQFIEVKAKTQSSLTAQDKLELEKMNDYETLYQDADRYFDDIKITLVFHRALNPMQARIGKEWN